MMFRKVERMVISTEISEGLIRGTPLHTSTRIFLHAPTATGMTSMISYPMGIRETLGGSRMVIGVPRTPLENINLSGNLTFF